MLKKIMIFITMIIFLNFIISCSTTSTISENQNLDTSGSEKIEAQNFQEILIRITGRKYISGKLLSLEADSLVVLPFPYWNVESIAVGIDEIYSIKLLEKQDNSVQCCATGFEVGFISSGIVAAINSKYKSDFFLSLLVSLGIGAISGLIGLIIGGISSGNYKTEYDFYVMSRQQKINAIKKILSL